MKTLPPDCSLSVVVPVHNAEATIVPLVEAISRELGGKHSFNLVLVDDGSRDGSYEVCRQMALANPRVKFLSLFKNFGQLNAILAGLREADGDVVIIMDDDLQNPPAEVHKLVAAIRQGYDFAFGSPEKRWQHSLWRRLASRLTSRVYETVFNKPKGLYASSYVAVRQDVVLEVIKYDGPYPILMGLLLRVTRDGCNVPVEHLPRQHGKSGYTLGKLLALWLCGITNFSILPLRISYLLGMISAAAGFAFLFYVIVEKLLYPEQVLVGWSSVAAMIMFFAGVQLVMLGMMGEYVGRIFLTLNRTPQSVVREKYNCSL